MNEVEAEIENWISALAEEVRELYKRTERLERAVRRLADEADLSEEDD